MKPTVVQGLSGRQVAEGQERDALNNELRPVLDATRAAVNQRSSFRATVSTSDSLGAYKRIWESEQAPTTGTWLVEAHAAGLDAAGDCAGYGLAALFQHAAGVPAQVGATTTLFSFETQAAFDARFGVDATAKTVYLEVRDAGVAAGFLAIVEAMEVLP